ncbi:hypothetical protein ALC56_09158 [Trachymyrmex septentrionalis]|uniref:Uncharacterized protein n=1 Tax=Trachymyrmex septentrionalis TaxID=34720 RepID=A0A195F6W6_9HYME|nr:hypothetical protein ALC56_09158 [Trachymyrmex septentrionalis]
MRSGNNLLILRRARSLLRKNFSSGDYGKSEKRAAAVKSRHSSMSLPITVVTAGCSSLGCTPGPLRSQTADRQGSGLSFRVELQSCNVHDHAAKQGQHEEE